MKFGFSSAYAVLLPLVPLLSLAAHNPGEYDLWDLGILTAALLLGFSAVLAILWLGLSRRCSPGTPAALTLLAAGWFYGYVRIRYVPGAIPAAALGTLLVVAWLVRARPALDGFARFTTCTSLVLVGWSGLLLAQQLVHGPTAVRRSRLVRALAEPIRARPAGQSRDNPAPDIYLIVLDEYAAAPVLREQLGFDNHPFEDSLRRLGFTIPPEVRSNYEETLLSLPSLLNFEHLTGLEADFTNPRDPLVLVYLATHNRAAHFFKANGYTYIVYSGWRGTSSTSEADVVLRPRLDHFSVRELERTELRRVFLPRTLLGAFRRSGLPADQAVLRGFDLLKEIPGLSAPTFTLAHFMLPHRPYRFNSTCGPATTARDPPHGSGEDRIAFQNQLECTNHQVLSLVHALLERSPRPPIILLQSDHGTRNVLSQPIDDYSKVPDSLFQAAARERFGAFGAYYLPDGGDSLFTGRVSTVNVLRNILVHYFGARLPRRPDYSYFFQHATGRFIPVASRGGSENEFSE